MIKASIKDLELRNLKGFKGHEQEDLYQGNIYYQGKKIGWYSDDAWGGSAIIDVDRANYEIIDKIAKEYLSKKYPNEKFLWGADILFSEIIELTLNARFFEKQQRTSSNIVGEFSCGSAFASGSVVASNSVANLERYARANNLVLEKVYKDPTDFQIA